MKNTPYIFTIVFIFILASTNLQAQAKLGPDCGDLRTGYGPFDYTNADHRKTKLEVVEIYHFTSQVENLVAGLTGHVGGDLNYTLRAFPNHHRALASMSKLALRDNTLQPKGALYSALCYFARAIQFKPDDALVRSLYGNHLLKLGQTKMAFEQFEASVKLAPQNPTLNYNLGLLYFKNKDYNQARIYAKKAYSLNFPLPGLKNKLISAGKWDN